MLAPIKSINGVSRVDYGNPSRAPHNAVWSEIFGLGRRREAVLIPPDIWSGFLPGCAKHIIPRDVNPETQIVYRFHKMLDVCGLVGVVVLCTNHLFL